MSEAEKRLERGLGNNKPEITTNPEEINKVIDVFVTQISLQWRIPSEVVRGWVVSEFFAPNSFVSSVKNSDGQIIGGECGCPLVEVEKHTLEEERRVVQDSLSALGFFDKTSIVHLGGLAVDKDSERQGIGKSIHDFMVDESRKRGYQVIVGQTYAHVDEDDGRFNNSWKRNKEHGWQLLCPISNDSYGPKVWLYIPLIK